MNVKLPTNDNFNSMDLEGSADLFGSISDGLSDASKTEEIEKVNQCFSSSIPDESVSKKTIPHNISILKSELENDDKYPNEENLTPDEILSDNSDIVEIPGFGFFKDDSLYVLQEDEMKKRAEDGKNPLDSDSRILLIIQQIQQGVIIGLRASESDIPEINRTLEEGRLYIGEGENKLVLDPRRVTVKTMSKEEYARFYRATFGSLQKIADLHKRLNAKKEKIQKNQQDGHYPLKASVVQIGKRNIDKKTHDNEKREKKILIEKLRNLKKEAAEVASELEKRKEKLKNEMLKVHDTLLQNRISERNQKEGEGKKIHNDVTHIKN